MSSPAFQPVASTLWVDSAITDSYSGPILTKKNRKRRERDSASFPANHARSVRARTMQMFWYSYFEKGCRTKWALDNPERQYGIWLIHGSWHCSCGTYIYCFPLALADIRPWPFVPFFQISLKNSELKTTYNTFRDCRRHFFREPFSKKLYTTQIPGWLFHWNTLIRLLLHFVFLELFLLITSLCFFFSPSHEHHLLPPGEKVLVVVSEKETSSIIAYTLRWVFNTGTLLRRHSPL